MANKGEREGGRNMKIALASDHAGFDLKKAVAEYLAGKGDRIRRLRLRPRGKGGLRGLRRQSRPKHRFRGMRPRHPRLRDGHRHGHRGQQVQGHPGGPLLERVYGRDEPAPQRLQLPDDGRPGAQPGRGAPHRPRLSGDGVRGRPARPTHRQNPEDRGGVSSHNGVHSLPKRSKPWRTGSRGTMSGANGNAST